MITAIHYCHVSIFKSIDCVTDEDCRRKRKNSISKYLCKKGKCEEDFDSIQSGQLQGMCAYSMYNF